jgi:hypothetical protein
MDSGQARYENGDRSVTIWKDRSQWLIGDERDVLEPLGIWRAYDDVGDFCAALSIYLTSVHGDSPRSQ